MGINVLDTDTINRIAAGEVIERPASIVKELTENAVDAGASAVTIEIRDGGIGLVRVTDNGCGIPGNEVRTAFLRHATSKITSADDLKGVRSLGFRGEALSSIAAVCRTEIITKTPASLVGTRMMIEGGVETAFEEVGAPEGTTVIARDVFFHTPVRRKFLKSPQTEAAHITDLAEHLALTRPNLSVRLIVNGQNRFHTSGNGSLKDIIYQLYGRETASALLPVGAAADGMSVTGFIGKPEISRGNRALEQYALNGRYIRSSVIAKAIEDGFGNRMMQHMYPFAVLLIEVDPEKVDVNVHPTKQEVRFSEPKPLYDFLAGTIDRTLREAELIRTADAPAASRAGRNAGIAGKDGAASGGGSGAAAGENDGTAGIDRNGTAGIDRNGAAADGRETAMFRRPAEVFEKNRPDAPTTSRTVLPDRPEKQKENAPLPGDGLKEGRFVREAPETGYAPASAGAYETEKRSGQLKFLSEETRDRVRIVGQVFDTYWIAEFEGSMYIIDQHAAHEKVNYERFMKAFEDGTVTSQAVFPPIILTLTEREAQLLSLYEEEFRSLGYEIEHFGGHEYAVRSVPDILPSVMKDAMLKEMIGSLSEDTGPSVSKFIIEKTASMSCKAAVKGNMRLSMNEAEALFSEMMKLKDPYNCPHGRPTVIRMTERELEKRFRRIV